MLDAAWRARFRAHIEDKGLSLRRVSLDSGQGAGYVHSILKDGKEPTLEKLFAVCDAAQVSPLWVLFGLDVTPEDEAMLRLLRQNPDARAGIYQILRAQGQGETAR